MATESIKVSARFPVTPERLYRAWLDSTEHGRFTGGGADIEPVVGGRFMSWDDYMTGMLLQLEPGKRIVMTLRTTEFPDAAPDSRLEVLFEPEGDGTRLTLIHTDIPAGEGDKYEDGWIDYYFEPMQRYFRKIVLEESRPHATHAAVKAKPKPRPKAKPRPKPKHKVSATSKSKRAASMPNKKAVRRKAAKVAKKRAEKKSAARAARKSAGRAKVRKGNRMAKRGAVKRK